MVFSSLFFLFYFLPVFWLLYLAALPKGRNLVLFLASLFFYAWGEPEYVWLLLCSAFFDYCCGRMIGYFCRIEKNGLSRAVLVFSLTVNLGILGLFKYADVWPLPVGISFYTFQTMSYTIDVFRR